MGTLRAPLIEIHRRLGQSDHGLTALRNVLRRLIAEKFDHGLDEITVRVFELHSLSESREDFTVEIFIDSRGWFWQQPSLKLFEEIRQLVLHMLTHIDGRTAVYFRQF